MRLSRFIQTVILALLFILLAGVAVPPSPWINTGVPSDAFWIEKAFNSNTYDVVLAGDSRVLKGLSPESMETVLQGTTIFNYGFDHNAYTQEYLLALDQLIAKDSACRTIVLGISPQSLTLEAAQRNGFLALRENGRFDRFRMRYLTPYLTFFEPYNLYQFVELLQDVPSVKYYQHHYKDGWVASRKEPEDPMYQVYRYQGRFENNKVSPRLTEQLLLFVRRWKQAGISVFGLRLPTSPAMLQLENRESGFHQEQFVRQFESAGGVWLDFDLTGYHSYDGSHLREDAARRLSRELARQIQRPMNHNLCQAPN